MGRLKMLMRIIAVFLLLGMTSAKSVVGPRERRSSEQTCDKNFLENLAKSAKETCSQIGAVDKYVGHVKARQQLPVPSFTDNHGFKAILNQYNGGLKTAQDHCQPWRNGDNVVGSLHAMVMAAKEFEPKFKQEFQENQDRLKDIIENHSDIATVEAKIAALENEIIETKEVLKFTNVSDVVSHLEAVIKRKEEEINTIQKEHEVAQARREVAELVKYLEFVKNGATEVEGKAETARTKITSFRNNIVRDAGAFKRHRTNAQEGIAKLQQEKTNNNNEINNNKQSITRLTAQINEENNKIASLNTQIANAQREINEIQARIDRNLRKTKKRRRFGSWFRFVPVVGWTIGNKFYKDAKRREEQLRNEKRNFVNEHTKQVANLRSHISRRQQDIASHRSRITSLEAKSRELEQELQHFTELNGKLQDIDTEVNVILPSIANAVSAVSKMKESFDTIKQNLRDAIERATEAKTEAEVKNIRYFIYNEIEQLKCKWENASVKIEVVGQCN